MTKISHISTIGVNLDFLDWKKRNQQNDQNETKQAKRAKRNETSETSGTTKTKQTLGHNEMTETIKGTYENRKKVNNNNKIKWMPKGVRRQPTYSSRFDYGLPLIYLTGKFNSLNSLDRLKKSI